MIVFGCNISKRNADEVLTRWFREYCRQVIGPAELPANTGYLSKKLVYATRNCANRTRTETMCICPRGTRNLNFHIVVEQLFDLLPVPVDDQNKDDTRQIRFELLRAVYVHSKSQFNP